jgi:hypothetical protein
MFPSGNVFIGFCMALLPQKQFWIPFGLLFRFGVIWENAG